MGRMRHAVVVTHARLRDTSVLVREAVEQLKRAGFDVKVVDSLKPPIFGNPSPAVDDDTEIVVVLGGDGTILGAAELVYDSGIPILGVNLGHVGFLAEFESFQLSEAISRVADQDYSIDERRLASVSVTSPDGKRTISDWALNDITVQQEEHDHMIELSIGVDGVEASSFSCDGVIVSTPTGSTAYAFSAGGPIIWPDVQALQLIPLAAHALFTRPMVIGEHSCFFIDVLPDSLTAGWICCDGRRKMRLEHGSRTTVQLSPLTIRLASLSGVPFTNRLVTKFDLPSVSLRQHSRLEERKRENMIASECSRRSTGEHTDELDSRQRPANRVNSEDAVDDDEYDGLTDWRACGSN
ncbi:NAD+ kinase [Bifidobacterium commune]|uniref:NAD kinase n=2 Tax=Bifidobacterium commune TaxID=1505727 RepID=A0A1C4H1C4_9BIFI|nr:NAD kinase [Bifidobacterium commune]MBB2954744.1 NAD+ kinase [Bifidobacterium commune]SCC78686.1 NAD+ kinase [Bifidobacterium commune]